MSTKLNEYIKKKKKKKTNCLHGHHVAWLDDVVAVEQLTGTRVAADVHEGVALVPMWAPQRASPLITR